MRERTCSIALVSGPGSADPRPSPCSAPMISTSAPGWLNRTSMDAPVGARTVRSGRTPVGRGNGEGANAVPDQSSLVGFGNEAANEAFCNSPNLPRFGPWDVQGNVQVRAG